MANPTQRIRDVKLVCAWCQRVIRNGAEETVSHGICQACEERVEKDYAAQGSRRASERDSKKTFDPPPVEEFRNWL